MKFNKLVNYLIDNIKSYSKIKDIREVLPIKTDNIEMFYKDNKIYTRFNKYEEFIYKKGIYILNIELLKNISKLWNIDLHDNNIFHITKFALEIKNKINEVSYNG